MDDKHNADGSPIQVQMAIKHKQGMPMQSQFEQAILDVYDFCMKEKEAGVPIIPLNHFAKRVTEMLKISDSSVKRVLKKRENGIPLAPLKRKRNRKSPVTDVDDYTRDAIARKVQAYQYQDKQFTMGSFLEECRMDLGFKGCEKSLRRILEKQLGFEFKKVDNKLKIEPRKMKKMKVKQEKVQQPQQMQRLVKKNVTNKSVSVSIQTQTQAQQNQAIPILDISMAPRTTMDEMGQVHSIPVHRLHPMDEHTLQQHRLQQQQHQQQEAMEHMSMSNMVHRPNVIENISLHQPPRIQDMSLINQFRQKTEKY